MFAGEMRLLYMKVIKRLCCKNSLTIQDVVITTSSSLLQNVAKIFFATEPSRDAYEPLRPDPKNKRHPGAFGGDRERARSAVDRCLLFARFTAILVFREKV